MDKQTETAPKCGVANPGGIPCTKDNGHLEGHDPAAYGPQTPERVWVATSSLLRGYGYTYLASDGGDDLVPYVREDTRTRSPLDVCWHCHVVLAYVPKPRCQDCPTECDEEGCTEPGCDLESASTPPTLAHVEGCTKALSVPVDLCECGGRVITWPASTPAVGAAADAKDIEQIASKLADAIYWARNQPTEGLRDLLIQFAAEIKRSAIEP